MTREEKNAYRRAWQKRRYAEDPEFRARLLASNKKLRDRTRDHTNAKKRERWRNDPEYRERLLAPRRGKDQRNSQLKVHYGISLDTYQSMKTKQGSLCRVCGKRSAKTLHVDHDHNSGAIRGLLCSKCNIGLGCFADRPELLRLAAYYLEDSLRVS